MQKCVIETNSDITSSLSELPEKLLSRRARLIEAVDRLELGVVAAGSVPLAVPGELTGLPRCRPWVTDAARLLRRNPEEFAGELMHAMLTAGAVTRRDRKQHATAAPVHVDPASLRRICPLGPFYIRKSRQGNTQQLTCAAAHPGSCM